MTYDEAIALAGQIRDQGGWHVLAIEPRSGEKLEDDHWSVMAICTLNWHYIHYFDRMVPWGQYAASVDSGERHRASSHALLG